MIVPAAWHIVHYHEVDSTQRVAAALVAAGVPGRTAVVAGRQTMGVGRKGDPWRDVPGASLLLTAILRPPWPRAAPVACYAMAAAVSVVEAVRDVAGADAAVSVKWPNDVLLGGRKVAGVLGDATWTGQKLEALRLGIGVNVGGTAEDFAAHDLPDATSIHAATGRDVTVEDALHALLARLAAWDDALSAGDRAGVVAAWRGAVGTVGQNVRVTLANGRELVGLATGVTEGGDLLLQVPGERKPLALSAGSVQSVRPA